MLDGFLPLHSIAMRERHFLTLLLLLSLAYGLICVASIIGDGPIIDEVEHVASGYFYLRTGLNSLNTTQPLLVKLWAALPLVAFPFNDGFSFPFRPEASSGASYAFNLLYDVPNSPIAMIGMARAAVIGLNVLLIWVLGVSLSKIIGRGSALLSVTLLVLSPTFLSHSRYVTNDVCVSLLISITLVFFSNFLTRPNLRSLASTVLSLALALQAKFSAIILFPILFMHSVFFSSGRVRWDYLKKLLILSATATLMLVVTFWGMSTRYRKTDNRIVKMSSPYWIPKSGFEAVTRGVVYQINRLQSGGAEPGYLGGILYSGGDTRFFPTLFLLKESIAWLIFVCAGLVVLGYRWKRYIESEFFSPYRALVALNALLISVYGVLAVFSGLNIGIRHLLPIYPSLAILAVLGSTRIREISAYRIKSALLVLAFASWLSAFPHFLSYFNLFAGEYPQFWAVDSNYDWGQDSVRLVKWISNNRRGERVYVDYFGRGHPLHYLPGRIIGWSSNMGRPPAGSTLFVSSTRIQQARGRRISQGWGANYEWLDDLEPVDTIGKTILVYKMPR